MRTQSFARTAMRAATAHRSQEPSNTAELYELADEPRRYQISTFLGRVVTTVRVEAELRRLYLVLEAQFCGQRADDPLAALMYLLEAAVELAAPVSEPWRIGAGVARETPASDAQVVHVYVWPATGTIAETWRVFKLLEHIAKGEFRVSLAPKASASNLLAARRVPSAEQRRPRSEPLPRHDLLDDPHSVLREILATYVTARAVVEADACHGIVPQLELRFAQRQPPRVRDALLHILKSAITANARANERWELHVDWHSDVSATLAIRLPDGSPREAARVMRMLEVVVQV